MQPERSMSRLAAAVKEPGRSIGVSVRRPIVMASLHLAVIWTAAMGLVWAAYRDEVRDWKRTASNISLTTAAYVQQALGAADLVLKSMRDWIAEEDFTSEADFRKVMSERRFFEVMSDRIVGLPQIGVVGIVARNGDLINNTASFPPLQANVAGREAFAAQMADRPPEVSLTGLMRSTTTNRWTFYLSRQVRSKSGVILGVIAVGLNSSYFSDFFRQVSLGDDSAIALLRTDGALLATTSTDVRLLGHRYPDAVPVQLIRDGASGTVDFASAPQATALADGRQRLVAPRLVDGFPLFVSVSIGNDVYLGAWWPKVYVVLGVAAILTALVLLVAVRVTRLMRRSARAERVAAERRLLATLVDTPSALCAVIDRQGGLLYCNARFRAVLGPGDNIDTAFKDPSVRGGDAVLEFAASDRREVAELDLEIQRPGEAACLLRFSASRQSLPDLGECTILVGHDETARHQAQRAIAQSAKMIMLGELTTGIAHELSQPLNVVRMAAQNALAEIAPADGGSADPDGFDPLPDDEFRKLSAGKFSRIIAQVDRAADIIARMRIFGRASETPAAPFDARDACRAALALIGPRIRSTGIVLHEQLGADALPMVGRRDLLEQVIINLLMNASDALKDSPRPDRRIDVVASTGPDGRVVIDIADNGPGVPAAIRDRIFEPFFTAKPAGQGTGLGLALSFGIVRDAGGTLSLRPGASGATFRIDLPAVAPQTGLSRPAALRKATLG